MFRYFYFLIPFIIFGKEEIIIKDFNIENDYLNIINVSGSTYDSYRNFIWFISNRRFRNSVDIVDLSSNKIFQAKFLGFTNKSWESIIISPDGSHIYIFDIGDKNLERGCGFILRYNLPISRTFFDNVFFADNILNVCFPDSPINCGSGFLFNDVIYLIENSSSSSRIFFFSLSDIDLSKKLHEINLDFFGEFENIYNIASSEVIYNNLFLLSIDGLFYFNLNKFPNQSNIAFIKDNINYPFNIYVDRVSGVDFHDSFNYNSLSISNKNYYLTHESGKTIIEDIDFNKKKNNNIVFLFPIVIVILLFFFKKVFCY
jgi:hypothetical protein